MSLRITRVNCNLIMLDKRHPIGIDIDCIAKKIVEHIWVWFLLLALSSVVSLLYIEGASEEIVTTIKLQGKLFVALKSTLSASFYATIFYILYLSLGLNRGYLTLLLLLYGFIYFTDFLIFNVYGMTFNNSTIGAALSTNPDEAEAFFDIILGTEYMAFPIVVLILITGITWVVYYFGKKYISSIIQHIIRYGLLVLLLVMFSGGLFATMGTVRRYVQGIIQYETATPIERLYFGYSEYSKEMKALSHAKKSLLAKDKDVVALLERSKMPDNVVLIMGESTSRNFMHCYGYPIHNTPRIDSLIQGGSMYLLDSVVSPAAATRESITASLTMHVTNEGRGGAWYDYPSILSVFSKAGFYTSWLSNQEKQGQFEISTIAETADNRHYVSVQSTMHNINAKRKSYDEVLLPHVQTKGKLKAQTPIFQIIHLMGTHTLFHERYPDSYKRFDAQSIPDKDKYPQDKREILAEYSNAILYNDYVVGEIIDKYKDEASIVIYVSDHGQGLYQDKEAPDVFGHLFSEVSLKIPMFIYVSPQMLQRRPELSEIIPKARSYRYMTDLLSHTICQLVGIETVYSNPKYELFSGKYDFNRPRIVRCPQGVITM